MKVCYGYKVCYREEGSKQLKRIFITRTLKEALIAKRDFAIHPPRKIKNPRWYVVPIKRKEVLKGIWREVPFDEDRALFIYI